MGDESEVLDTHTVKEGVGVLRGGVVEKQTYRFLINVMVASLSYLPPVLNNWFNHFFLNRQNIYIYIKERRHKNRSALAVLGGSGGCF